MDAQTFLKRYSFRAELFNNTFFARKKKKAAKVDPQLGDALQRLHVLTSKGKRLRGALTLLGYQIAHGLGYRRIIPVSLAVELIHASILIHDDFIDRDALRRGGPTVHEFFAKGTSPHHGASMAIIIGDIGIFLGNELLAGCGFNPEKLTRAIVVLNSHLVDTGYGELLDITFDLKTDVTWDDIIKVRIYKSAYYTFLMPLKVGALLADVSFVQMKAIKDFGISVGLAFQLTDDMLGIFGDPKKTGKSNESDIREGKKTLLLAKALELAGDRDRDFLKKWYGAKDLDRTNIDAVRRIILDSGSLGYSRELARHLIEKGKRHIPQMTGNKELQNTLSSFADFMIDRKS